MRRPTLLLTAAFCAATAMAAPPKSGITPANSRSICRLWMFDAACERRGPHSAHRASS